MNPQKSTLYVCTGKHPAKKHKRPAYTKTILRAPKNMDPIDTYNNPTGMVKANSIGTQSESSSNIGQGLKPLNPQLCKNSLKVHQI